MVTPKYKVIMYFIWRYHAFISVIRFLAFAFFRLYLRYFAFNFRVFSPFFAIKLRVFFLYLRYFAFSFRVISPLAFAFFRLYSRYFAFDFYVFSPLTFAGFFCNLISRFSPLFALFRI